MEHKYYWEDFKVGDRAWSGAPLGEIPDLSSLEFEGKLEEIDRGRLVAGSDVRAGGVPKYRGEDNRAVLSELLGLDAAALDQLESQGVLTSRVPGGAR